MWGTWRIPCAGSEREHESTEFRVPSSEFFRVTYHSATQVPSRGALGTRNSELSESKKICYGPEDWSGDPGKPGEFPFTRGVYPKMYTDRPWTMRQYAG